MPRGERTEPGDETFTGAAAGTADGIVATPRIGLHLRIARPTMIIVKPPPWFQLSNPLACTVSDRAIRNGHSFDADAQSP